MVELASTVETDGTAIAPPRPAGKASLAPMTLTSALVALVLMAELASTVETDLIVTATPRPAGLELFALM
jgi:hypothetical protein